MAQPPPRAKTHSGGLAARVRRHQAQVRADRSQPCRTSCLDWQASWVRGQHDAVLLPVASDTLPQPHDDVCNSSNLIPRSGSPLSQRRAWRNHTRSQYLRVAALGTNPSRRYRYCSSRIHACQRHGINLRGSHKRLYQTWTVAIPGEV